MKQRQYATLETNTDDSLSFKSSYDAGLVAALKSTVPPTARRWNPADKCWLVRAQYGDAVAKIAEQYLGVQVTVPSLSQTTQQVTRLVKLEYLGAAKDRGGDIPTAFGYADDDWSLVFPLPVLRRWFEPSADSRPGGAPTLYGVLGVKRDAPPIVIKKAYRRAALQWHPDHCQEPDAKEQFMRIQHAYEVLADIGQRSKYDVGLRLAASVGKQVKSGWSHNVWRSPLRCGLLLVIGTLSLGRLNVQRVLKWDDITNTQGQTMTSFWPRGGKTFQIRWL